MAIWSDLLETGLSTVNSGVEGYLLYRNQRSEQKIAEQRAAAERAQADAQLMAANATRDTIAKFGQWALAGAAVMLGLTILAQFRRMWGAR